MFFTCLKYCVCTCLYIQCSLLLLLFGIFAHFMYLYNYYKVLTHVCVLFLNCFYSYLLFCYIVLASTYIIALYMLVVVYYCVVFACICILLLSVKLIFAPCLYVVA